MNSVEPTLFVRLEWCLIAKLYRKINYSRDKYSYQSRTLSKAFSG